MKLDRLLRNLEKKYNYGIICEEEIIEITQKYFQLYQIDTIVRDLAHINRLKEYELEYCDYEKIEYNIINVNNEGSFFNLVKEIITDKIKDRNY